MRALVVDDSGSIRAVLANILASCGFETVEQAENGRLGLDRIEADPVYHLVLVDWNMPVMTGIEFVRAIRANPRWDATRIVMVTTEDGFERMREALSAGANGYVVKPFSRDEIRAKLRAIGLDASADLP